jgi:hypothetical protein
MTDQSSLEKDAERVRAELADTAEHLKDKMSPGQLMDEVVNYFKDGDTNQLLSNLKHQVRDNPLALAVVGSGLAWLMMGSGPSTTSSRTASRPAPRWTGGASGRNGTSPAGSPVSADSSAPDPGSPGLGSSIGKGAAAVKSAAGEAAHGLGDAVSSAADAVSATMHDMHNAASDSFSNAANTGAEIGARAKSTFIDALEREPLVIGALGVAVGAAIGAMLPTTRTEQDYMGAASAKAREKAEGTFSDGIDKAKHVAKDVYSAARDEADHQGLTSTGKPISAKIADVAKAAGNELKSAVDDTTRQAEKSLDQSTDRIKPSDDRNG